MSQLTIINIQSAWHRHLLASELFMFLQVRVLQVLNYPRLRPYCQIWPPISATLETFDLWPCTSLKVSAREERHSWTACRRLASTFLRPNRRWPCSRNGVEGNRARRWASGFTRCWWRTTSTRPQHFTSKKSFVLLQLIQVSNTQILLAIRSVTHRHCMRSGKERRWTILDNNSITGKIFAKIQVKQHCH